MRDNIIHVQEEENQEKEAEEEQLKLAEKLSDVQEKVQLQQQILTQALQFWYSSEGDSAILQAIENMNKEESENDDFELVETSELGGDEYKEFERRSKEQHDKLMGTSQYGFLDGKILFQSNYFGDKSLSADNSIPQPPQDVKTSADKKTDDILSEKDVYLKPLKDSKEEDKYKDENRLSLGLSSNESLSSEGDEYDEMVGTFYFLDTRKTKLKQLLSESDISSAFRNRRLSAEEPQLESTNPFLQASIAPEKLKATGLSVSNWRNIHAFIQHKAQLCKWLASILSICLPYKIHPNGKIENKGKFFSLRPVAGDEGHHENMLAYKMLKEDVEYLYRNIKQISKAHHQGERIELISKILNAI